MLSFKIKRQSNGKPSLTTNISGKALLTIPQLNKGTAFTLKERQDFDLLGKLPPQVENLKKQVERAYWQYQQYQTAVQKNRYLMSLLERNQVLFYKLVSEHLTEMMPIIYTPTIGDAVKTYSREFRFPHGLYIAYPDINNIDKILANRTQTDIDLIVVTDGEGVLGIGDQGIGSINIPIGKLMVYTLCGQINPLRTLPIVLDVGTNNEQLLQDPMYLGWRHRRLTTKQYDHFIAKFIAVVKKQFPQIFLHWEDFGRDNAHRNLDIYRDKICSFNDDIQGTAGVTLAAILAAIKAKKEQLADQRFVIFGAGTAGIGITEEIYAALLREGVPASVARQQFWLIDKEGLVTRQNKNLTAEQKLFAHNATKLTKWRIKDPRHISLAEVVKNIAPTVLIGCSGVAGAFSKNIITTMAQKIKKPIILALSNPTERAEATPENIINWTKGNALVATGSPFAPVSYNGRKITIAQCNNALIFPGLGLGIIACGAKTVTDNMLWQACRILANSSPIIKNNKAPLLPSIEMANKVALKIAHAVVKQAQIDKVARKSGEAKELVKPHLWQPKYLPYVRKSGS